MKRPQHMTMSELVGLPVLDDPGTIAAAIDADGARGGAFRDEGGSLWGTMRIEAGWARYPAHLALLATARQRAAPQSDPLAGSGPRPGFGLAALVRRRLAAGRPARPDVAA